MARISMGCSCGWKFFIAGSTQGWQVACPNCGLAVRIPGRKVGQAGFATAGALAAAKEKGWTMARMAIGLGVALGVGVIILLVVMSGGHSTQDYSGDSKSGGLFSNSNMPSPPHRNERTTLPPPPPPPPPPPDPAALRLIVRQTTWMINIAGVVAETLRLRGVAEDRDRLIAQAADWENKLRATVARLEEAEERAQVEDYIRPGDTIVGFAQKDFSTMNAAGAADLMAQWLHTFRSNSMEQVILSRGPQRVVVYVDIPEASKELLELARTPTGDMGKGIAGNTPAAQAVPDSVLPDRSVGKVAIPDDVVNAIESGFSALPAGYRNLLPVLDRNRIAPLLQSRKGTEDDLKFLQDRILTQALPAYEKEAVLVKAKVAELEAKLKGTTAVDVIHFKDGRKVEGMIVQETEETVKIKARLGTITIPRADILRVEKGKGAGLEFPDKLKAAEGKLEGLVSLLAWCKEKNLKLEGEYVAYRILAIDPANEPARATVSLARPLK